MYAHMHIPCLSHSIDVGPKAITDKERGVKVRGERANKPTPASQSVSSQTPYRAASRRFQISCAYRENRGGERGEGREKQI